MNKCLFCGKSLEGKNRKARYCDDAHKMAYRRKNRNKKIVTEKIVTKTIVTRKETPIEAEAKRRAREVYIKRGYFGGKARIIAGKMGITYFDFYSEYKNQLVLLQNEGWEETSGGGTDDNMRMCMQCGKVKECVGLTYCEEHAKAYEQYKKENPHFDHELAERQNFIPAWKLSGHRTKEEILKGLRG